MYRFYSFSVAKGFRVKKYAMSDNRIKIIEHDVNRGLMMTRRTGYMAASGDYITFLDSDDTFAPGALEVLYSVAIKKNADIVSGTIQYVPNEGMPYKWANNLQYGSDKISVYKSLLKDEFGHNLCSKLFRKEIMQDYNYQTYEKVTNGEDGILFYQLLENAKKIIAVDNIVYEYYQNMESSTNVRLKERALWSILIANAIRVNIVGKYQELKEILSKKVSSVLFELKMQGYDIDKFVAEQKLEHYCKTTTYIKDHGIFSYMKQYIRFIFNKIHGIKDCRRDNR